MKRVGGVHLLALPQRLDALLDTVEHEAAHVSMISRPLSVLRVTPAGLGRRMEMLPGVVPIRMSIPPTLPDTVLPLLLVMDVEVVVAIPANLETS